MFRLYIDTADREPAQRKYWDKECEDGTLRMVAYHGISADIMMIYERVYTHPAYSGAASSFLHESNIEKYLDHKLQRDKGANYKYRVDKIIEPDPTVYEVIQEGNDIIIVCKQQHYVGWGIDQIGNVQHIPDRCWTHFVISPVSILPGGVIQSNVGNQYNGGGCIKDGGEDIYDCCNHIMEEEYKLGVIDENCNFNFDLQIDRHDDQRVYARVKGKLFGKFDYNVYRIYWVFFKIHGNMDYLSL